MTEVVLWLVFIWLCCGCAAMWIADHRAWATGRRRSEWTWKSFAAVAVIVAIGPVSLYGLFRRGDHWSKKKV
jgi:hypothetical protein